MCDNAIEDEFHFLCICPIYQNLRENLYSSYYNISNDFMDLSGDQKFVYMLIYLGFYIAFNTVQVIS